MTVKTKTKPVKWFARGGGIARSGPFDTQVEATRALRLAPEDAHWSDTPAQYARKVRKAAARFPPDAFVWPEET
jgi:hypothetical protein